MRQTRRALLATVAAGDDGRRGGKKDAQNAKKGKGRRDSDARG